MLRGVTIGVTNFSITAKNNRKSKTMDEDTIARIGKLKETVFGKELTAVEKWFSCRNLFHISV